MSDEIVGGWVGGINQSINQSGMALGDSEEGKKIMEAKRSYRAAKEVGNREEAAKWANVIGNLLKKRGEYVEALKWLRIDCDISFDFLSPRHCFPSCQSLGDVYLLLKDFPNALFFQVFLFSILSFRVRSDLAFDLGSEICLSLIH